MRINRFQIWMAIVLDFEWRFLVLGSVHNHYDLTGIEFSIFNLSLVMFATCLIIYQIRYLIDKDPSRLKKTFWACGLLLFMSIMGEVLLQRRFEPKG